MSNPGSRGRHPRRKARSSACVIAAALLVALAGSVPVHAADPDELQEVYQQIIKDPGNSKLNFRYASLAIERGELRKALAAYERILARDPNNEEAKAGLRRVRRLLRPDLTTAIVVLGGQFESNPRRVNNQFPKRNDGVFFARLQVDDRRRIGQMRWRTLGDLFTNFHVQERDLDFGNAGFRTGPVLDLGDSVRVHTFGGFAYSWFDGETFYFEPSAGLTFEFDNAGPLKTITVKGAYNFINEGISRRDAFRIELVPRFVFREFLSKRSILVASPYWRYNGVVGSGAPGTDPRGDRFPQTFHQFGVRFDLFYRLAKNITGAVNLTAEYQHYEDSVLFGTQSRRDVLLSPGAQVIFSGLIGRNFDVIVSYTFEYNSSNDGIERYTNHIVGVRLLRRF